MAPDKNTAARPLLALCATLLALAPVARADDQTDRDRRAKAALALAAKPAVTTAPAPRAVPPKDYPTGYKAATAEAKPLVVFVGADPAPVPGALVATAADLPGVKAPAAVVAYPVGGKLYVHETLDATRLDADKLVAAVRAASKKIVGARTDDRLAPRPLDWDVRANPEGARLAGALAVAPPCAGGVCPVPPARPAPNAAALPDTITTTDGARYTRAADGYYYPSADVTLAGAVAPVPRSGGVSPPTARPALPARAPQHLPTFPFPPSCPSGKCPLK